MENQGQHNQLVEQADEYLRRNRILELFEDLSTQACFKQPENFKEFIVDELKIKLKFGYKTSIFSPEEIKNTFELFDLMREGFISKDKCRQALLTMAGSEYQEQVIMETDALDDKVDFSRFSRLCDMLVGIKIT